MKSGDSNRKWWNLFSGMLRSAWRDPNAWESSIRQFVNQDRLSPPTPGGILFVGSSTFTLWATLEKDMSPLRVVNRGFGGAKMADVLRYFDRIVVPQRPKAVVLFVGTNDIAGRRPATAQEVFQGYLAFARKVRSTLPQTPTYYVAITPTPARWKHRAIVNEANRLIQEYSRKDPLLHFIDQTARFIGADGKPDRRLYRVDRLHPNRLGYALLTDTIKPILEADLGSSHAEGRA
jgi:lysophospholipase L1-like esterase